MGTVKERNGSYRAMVRKVGHGARYKTFPSAREARAWVRHTETELEAREVTNPKILIADLIDRYVKEIAPKRRMAASHLAHDIPSIRRKFADMRMSDLVGTGLSKWVLQQAGGVAASTAHWHIARLCGVLRQAEQHWDVVVPWADISRCRRKLMATGYLALPAERDRRVTDAELAKIKLAMPAKTRRDMHDLLDFCVASAMRIGEVCRIEWRDLDEQAATVVIRDRKHPTKKFGNDQVVPLLGAAFDIVQRQPRDDGRIFRRTPIYVSKVFHAAALKAGLEDVVLHDLRHEGISRLFELGFEIQEVALVSGHTNWRTLARYTHLKPASLVAKFERLRAAA